NLALGDGLGLGARADDPHDLWDIDDPPALHIRCQVGRNEDVPGKIGAAKYALPRVLPLDVRVERIETPLREGLADHAFEVRAHLSCVPTHASATTSMVFPVTTFRRSIQIAFGPVPYKTGWFRTHVRCTRHWRKDNR